MSKLFKTLRNLFIVLATIYVALFALTSVIRYPEPISSIRLALAPASKTPFLMPAHTIAPSASKHPWAIGAPEVPETVMWNKEKISFDSFLERTQTNAFLIIRDGAITYEKYRNGKSESSLLPSYSVAKTMTSLMIGKLISEGKLKESDTFVSVLPEFKAGTNFDQVKISDLLDMSGGLAALDNYPDGPAGWGVAIAQMYATTDLNYFMKNNRRMDSTPGTKADYRSIDTQMLGLVIKKITGEKLADYFSKSFWAPVGAEYAATWNVDRIGGQEKTFCCFNAAARDYARIGQLLLNNGASSIGGANLIDANWMKRLTTSKVTLDRNWGYGAQIWHPYSDSNLMMGLHGQYVFIQPSTHTVIVKLSDEPTKNGDNESYTAAVLHDIARALPNKK